MQLECCFRVFIIHIKKNKIEKLFISIQKFITEPELQKYQTNIKRRLTRFIILMLILFFTSYTMAFLTNVLSHHGNKEVKNTTNFTSNLTLEQQEYQSYVRTFKKFVPYLEADDEVLFYSIYIFCCIGILLLVTTDVLFYALYYIILAELQVLTQILNKCINNADQYKMEWWLRKHQHLIRYVKIITFQSKTDRYFLFL
jgi:hypothetical protein